MRCGVCGVKRHCVAGLATKWACAIVCVLLRLETITIEPGYSQCRLAYARQPLPPVHSVSIAHTLYWDTTPLLSPPTTDVEWAVDAFAQSELLTVPDDTRRDVLLDFRHAAMSTDNPRATSQPLLLDRLGRPIERGRDFEGVPDGVQGPVDIRRPDHEQFVQGAAPPPIDERPGRMRDYMVPGR